MKTGIILRRLLSECGIQAGEGAGQTEGSEAKPVQGLLGPWPGLCGHPVLRLGLDRAGASSLLMRAELGVLGKALHPLGF